MKKVTASNRKLSNETGLIANSKVEVKRSKASSVTCFISVKNEKY